MTALPWLVAAASLATAAAIASRLQRARRALAEARTHGASARAAAERRTRTLADRAALGVFAAAPDGRLLDANASLAAMLGHASPAALCAADHRADVLAAIADAGRAGGGVEREWRRADGQPALLRATATAVHDDEGRLERYAGLVEDAGQRQRQDEVLQRGEHLASLGRMLAGAAHELNNPLAAVCGFAQLLLRGAPRDEDRQALETIDHEARRAASIVRDLLTFSRGRSLGTRQLVDLNAVVRYVAQTRRYALETSGVQLALEIVPGPLEVLGDRTQVEQIVLNLVANAAEALEGQAEARERTAGDADGDGAAAASRALATLAALAAAPPRVVVRTVRREREAWLEVADNGPGIPAAQLPRIWDPFFTTKGERDGTGLGLSVVHRLVTDHGGLVEVESQEGAGACFRVSIPLPTAEERAMLAAAAEETAGRPLDVLLLDADDGTSDFLARYLTGRGHAVLAASAPEQALRLAGQAGVDVVVLALAHVGHDGALLTRLRSLPTLVDARCVVTVPADRASTDADPVLAAALQGCTLLATPHDIEQLRRAVEGE